MRRAGPPAVALLLTWLATLCAAPAALADGNVPIWPIDSFTLLFIGFAVVIVILVISAAILGRISHADREQRFERQYEARLAERSAAEVAVPAAASSDGARERRDPPPQEGDDR